ncbi:MAG: lipopolysaccharide heptosyltransferase I [Pseudomonadales bacterium]
MSQQVLLIKITSMGDLMHALPALTDAAKAIPGVLFDWVADQAFAEIPAWHPAVNRVIKSDHRRWKKNVMASFRNGELKLFYRELNRDNYDLVIDSQNNLKSAAVALLRRIGTKTGEVHGLDKACVREKPAHWVYTHQHFVDRNEHSITHQRQLMAKALGYPMPSSVPDYGINRSKFYLPDIELPERYLFFVHNASWITKLWPEQHWQQLIELAIAAGYSVLLPCGNEEEQQRAKRITAPYAQAHTLPRLSLSALAAIMDKAEGAACCDTGLGHLAGVLDLPSVSFYGPTDAKLIGSIGQHQQHIIAATESYNCAPCYRKTCRYEGYETSACMQSFSPQGVWENLKILIDRR